MSQILIFFVLIILWQNELFFVVRDDSIGVGKVGLENKNLTTLFPVIFNLALCEYKGGLVTFT